MSTANENWCRDYAIKAENKLDSAIKLAQLAIGEADDKDVESALLDIGVDLVRIRNRAREVNAKLKAVPNGD